MSHNSSIQPLDARKSHLNSQAARQGLGAHGIRLYNIDGKRCMELHLEVADAMTLEQAHTMAQLFEDNVRREIPLARNFNLISTKPSPKGGSIENRCVCQASGRLGRQSSGREWAAELG